MAKSAPYKDCLLVRLRESDYSRKWGLSGSLVYQMSACQSKIVFQQAGQTVTIARGLIKWFCGSSRAVDPRSRQTPAAATAADSQLFYLEISSDSAHGAGVLELEHAGGDGSFDIAKWVERRVLPSRGWQNFKRTMGGWFRALFKTLATACSCLFRCHKTKPAADNFFQPRIEAASKQKSVRKSRNSDIIVACEEGGFSDRLEGNNSSGIIEKARINSDTPKKERQISDVPKKEKEKSDISLHEQKMADAEKQAHSDISRFDQVNSDTLEIMDRDNFSRSATKKSSSFREKKEPQKEDGLSRTESFKVVRFRRNESMKKLKRGVNKVLSSLATAGPNSERAKELRSSTYRSFEDLNDCFHIDDDCSCYNVDHANPPDNLDNNNLDKDKVSDRLDKVFSVDNYSHLDWRSAPTDDVDEEGEETEEIFDTDSGAEDLAEDNPEGAATKRPSPRQQEPRGSSSSTTSFYETRTESLQLSANNIVPVAFDDTDDSVIVMDDMDIYRVSRKHASLTRQEEVASEPDLSPSRELAEKSRQKINQGENRSCVELSSSVCSSPSSGENGKGNGGGTSDEYEMIEREHLALAEAVAAAVQQEEVPSSSPSAGPGDSSNQAPAATSETASSASATTETETEAAPIRPPEVARYVDQSKSLTSLRSSSRVVDAIKMFDQGSS